MWTWPRIVKFEPSLRCIPYVNKVAVQHAESLTRQLKGIQIIQRGFARSPTKDVHSTIDKDSSMTGTGRRNGTSAL
jgi:hypothetical protein